MQKEMTWEQFGKVYGVGMTEHKALDVKINKGKFGAKMISEISDPMKVANNTFYTFNVYNLETDNDVLTSEWSVDTIEEIIDIIADEFNIVDN